MNSQIKPIFLMLALAVMVLVYNPPTTIAQSNLTEAPSTAVQAADSPLRRVLAAAALSPPDAKGRQRRLAVGGFLAGPPKDRDAIRLYDFAGGEVQALAFSPSGRWLASAGKDRTLRLWDLSSLKGQRLGSNPLVLKGHTI